MFDKKSIDQQMMDICKKLFKKAVNCEFDYNTVKSYPNEIRKTNLLLLFSLPGIFITALATITGNKKYQELINTIEETLNSNTDYEKIYMAFKDLIFSNPFYPIPESTLKKLNELNRYEDPENYQHCLDKELGSWFPNNVRNTFEFLLDQESIHFDQPDQPAILSALIVTMDIYFILLCMFFKTVATKKGCDYLKLEDFLNITMEYEEFKGEFNIFNFSLIFSDASRKMINKSLNKFTEYKNDKITYYSIIPIPSTDLFLHKLVSKKETFGVVSKHKQFQKTYNRKDVAGLAYNINIFDDLDFELWQIARNINNDSKDNPLDDSYLLINTGNNKDILDMFFLSMYKLAKKSSLIISLIIKAWDDFIENPNKTGELDSEDIIKWMSYLGDQDELFQELVEYKPLYRLLTGLDSYFPPTKDYDKIRKKNATAFRKNVSPALKSILKEAKNEVEKILKHLKKKKKKNIEKHIVVGGEISKGNSKKDRNTDELKKIAKDYLVRNKTSFKHVKKEDLKWLELDDPEHGNRNSIEAILNKVGIRNGKDLSKPLIWKSLEKDR
ncbi:MAG: hypothetical protein HOC24_09735 [Deltaproteobacteria bacterium]|jgi:hypothetical protein|nr:hypothetical protein [Deltaproteobacteria bacterium]